MPPTMKRVLFRGEMRTIDEVAKLTGVKPNAVRMRIKEGRSLELPTQPEQYRLKREARAALLASAAYQEAQREKNRARYKRTKRMGLTMNTASVTLMNDVLAALESGRTREVRDKIMRSPHYAPTRALLIRAERRGKAKTVVRELRADVVHALGEESTAKAG